MKRHILHYIKNIACILCMLFLVYWAHFAQRMLNTEVDFRYMILIIFIRIGLGAAIGLLIADYVSGKKIPKVWMITLTIFLGFFTAMGVLYFTEFGNAVIGAVSSSIISIALYDFFTTMPYAFGAWLIVMITNIIRRSKA